MLGHTTACQPAPMLAYRAIGLRLRLGPRALGNALGSSLAEALGSEPTAGSGLRVPADTAASWGPRLDVGAGSALPTSFELNAAGVRLGGDMPDDPASVAEVGLRGTLNSAERAADPARYAGVEGSSRIACAGDSNSRMIGSNHPQAVGNFMRANGLTSDRIEVGRNYFVPEDARAYGDSAALGQFALNQGNERSAAAGRSEMQRELNRFAAMSEPASTAPVEAGRLTRVLGYAATYPELARQIEGYGQLVAAGVMTPEQAREHLLASPRASTTLRSDYEVPVANDPPAPQMRAWDGVSSDPYASTRQNLEKAFVLPQLTAAASLAASGFAVRGLASQLALQPATQIGVTDVVTGMGTHGAISGIGYVAFQQEDSTPAGAAVASVAGAIGGGLVRPVLNLAARLPNTAIPFTWANAVTYGTGFSFGFGTVGWLNGPPGLSSYGAATRSGQSWWTMPPYASPPKP